jgi:hypothetical protein
MLRMNSAEESRLRKYAMLRLLIMTSVIVACIAEHSLEGEDVKLGK